MEKTTKNGIANPEQRREEALRSMGADDIVRGREAPRTQSPEKRAEQFADPEWRKGYLQIKRAESRIEGRILSCKMRAMQAGRGTPEGEQLNAKAEEIRAQYERICRRYETARSAEERAALIAELEPMLREKV